MYHSDVFVLPNGDIIYNENGVTYEGATKNIGLGPFMFINIQEESTAEAIVKLLYKIQDLYKVIDLMKKPKEKKEIEGKGFLKEKVFKNINLKLPENPKIKIGQLVFEEYKKSMAKMRIKRNEEFEEYMQKIRSITGVVDAPRIRYIFQELHRIRKKKAEGGVCTIGSTARELYNQLSAGLTLAEIENNIGITPIKRP